MRLETPHEVSGFSLVFLLFRRIHNYDTGVSQTLYFTAC